MEVNGLKVIWSFRDRKIECNGLKGDMEIWRQENGD